MPLRLIVLRSTALIGLMTALTLSAAQGRDPAPPVRAEPQRSAMETPGHGMDSQQQEALLRQKRRDNLREMLRVQSEEGTAATRQLSAQEKLELRQQLRQQQEWLNK